MLQLKTASLLAFMFIIGACVSADNERHETAPVFNAAIDGPSHAPNSFTLSQDGLNCQIEADGDGLCVANSDSLQFGLPIEVGDRLEKVQYARLGSRDILVLYEYGNVETGATRLARFDDRTMQTQWVSHIPSFNAGKPLVLSDQVYVTAHGFVGRVDTETGEFAWRHDDLYKSQAFNHFRQPQISNGEVRFVDGSSDQRYIVIDQDTGKVLEKST